MLVGVLTGLVLHHTSGFLNAFLKLTSQPEEQQGEQRGRTMASYRARRKEKAQLNFKKPPANQTALLTKVDDKFRDVFLDSATILEEDDTSDADL